MPLLDDSEWKPIGNPVAYPRQPSGILRRVVGDTAIDAGKGAIQLGQSAVGLADLATAGLAGDALKYVGYDPEGTQQWLDQYYSTQRQEAEQEVGQAEGFFGKMGALATNPSAMIGRGVQSAPQMLSAMGAAGRAYQATNSLKAATAAGHIGEGVLTAGSVAQDIRNQGGDRGDMYWAVPAGAITGAIGYGAGRLLPEGQIESMLIPGARALTNSGKPVGLLRRAGTSAFSEGVLEEAPQSAQEQMFTNIGTGKPLMYQVPEAAGEGLMVGGATGGVLGGFHRHAAQPTNLLPGANSNQNPSAPPAPLMPVAPRLDPNAQYGQTGTLFGGQPDLVQQTAAPTDPYAEMRGQVSQLIQMLNEASAAGDDAQVYAINQALGQVTSQMTELNDNSLNQRNLFDTGIYEMVGNQPYQLTGDQVAAGGLESTENDPREQVPQDTRLAEIRHALTQANGGKANAQLLRFIPEFRTALDQGPDAVQAVLSKYDNPRSTLRPDVLETASQLADIYRSQDVNGMAMNGIANAQPGVQFGQAPVSNATEMAMRESNQARDAQETVDVENMLQREQDQQDTRSQLESLIPERQEKLSPGGQRRLFTNAETGRVIPNAAPELPTKATAPGSNAGSKQGKLFTTRGQPTQAAQRTGPAPGTPTTVTVEEQPRKPRKSTVKAKVGDQEVQLEVPDAESRVAEMQRDVDKFEAFVACLRRK